MPPSAPMPRTGLLVPLVAALLLAGCLSPAADLPATTPADATAPAKWDFAPFELSGKECTMASFVAAYPMGSTGSAKLAEVWELADIREEIGNPTRDATANPVLGPLMGNWHMGVRCATAATTAGDAEEFVFGFVGDMVKAPAWDAGGADLHFLLSGLSFANGTIGDAMRNSSTADVTHTARVDIDWSIPKELPRSFVEVQFLDAEKGLYESASTMSLYRELQARTIRLWWQVPADGTSGHGAHHHDAGGSITSFGTQVEVPGEWAPIYWDLTVSGGPQYTTPPADGVELASHNRFSFEHGPVAAQPCVTNVYENAELSFSQGRVVEGVVLPLLWTH